MKKVVIIGSGNIGSRHLQALKAVKIPLEIFVIDPIKKSLELARGRYEAAPGGKISHKVNYLSEIPDGESPVDLAIIATCSDIRAGLVRKLLKKSKVRYLVLEKLLFSKKKDYDFIGELLKKYGTKTWVNCPMRMMPFYRNLRPEFPGQTIFYNATWSGANLITSAIHYLDHMVFLTGSDDFVINTDGLDKKPVPSKRKGFSDFTGTLHVLFKNGSVGEFVCLNKGNTPSLVQFHYDQARCVVRETESKAWVSKADNSWRWDEVDALIPFQSQLTTVLAENILSKGTCQLIGYEQSKKIHLQLLEPLRMFLNKNSRKRYDFYPFT